MAGGDVDDPHRAALLAQLYDRQAQQFLDMQFALANAAPADRVQVVTVDHPPDGGGAGGGVAVDVVQGAAGVETCVETQLESARQSTAQAHAGAGHAPVAVAQGVVWQGRGQGFRFGARQAQAVGGQQRRALERLLEVLHNEAPGTGDGDTATLLAEGVVEEAWQDVFFLVQAAQALEELLLRSAMHHEVGTGDQELGGYLYGLGIGDHSLGGVIQTEQYIYRNGFGDQRVVVVGRHPFRVMAEKARLDIAVDEKVTAKPPHQGQPLTGERYVELHVERRRRQHQCADVGGVVVDPGRDDHRPDALGNHGHVRLGNLVGRLQVIAERLHVTHAGSKARAVATLARGQPVAP